MMSPDHAAGTGARTPFQVPPEGWLAVLKRTWAEMGADNIGIIAAGIAFYAFAAIVPLLGAVVLSYGLFADAATVQRNVESVFAALPREAASIISDQLLNVVRSSEGKQGFGLALALAIAWYGATKGASAIVTGLNVAYDEEETRGFVALNLLQLALVAGGVLVIFLSIVATALLGFLESLIPGAPGVVLATIRVAGYLVLAALVVTAASVLFRFGPDHRSPRWIWLSPGSAGATLLWLVGTSGFGIYVSNFGNYGATYGSLSAVVVLLTWLWLSAYVFLLGAELNAELERQVKGGGPAAAVEEEVVPPPSAAPAGEPRSVGVAFAAGGAAIGAGVLAIRFRRALTLAVVVASAFAAWRRSGDAGEHGGA